MIKLTCDICSGKLVMGSGGIAICDNCGMEYTSERLKEKMQEARPTFNVESTNVIDNYFKLAESAFDASNYEETTSYCNKIIEINPTNYKAWFVKGKAAGWQSTLVNQRICEAINAFVIALENCPTDKKESLGLECKSEIEKLFIALLNLRMDNFMISPSAEDVDNLSNDLNNYVLYANNFSDKTGIGVELTGIDAGCAILEPVSHKFLDNIYKKYIGDDGKPGDYEFKEFISEIDCCIEALEYAAILYGNYETDDLILYDFRILTYDTMISYNTSACESCSWDYNFDSNGNKIYFKNLTLSDDSIVTRMERIKGWKEKSEEWKMKKSIKENEIQ